MRNDRRGNQEGAGIGAGLMRTRSSGKSDDEGDDLRLPSLPMSSRGTTGGHHHPSSPFSRKQSSFSLKKYILIFLVGIYLIVTFLFWCIGIRSADQQMQTHSLIPPLAADWSSHLQEKHKHQHPQHDKKAKQDKEETTKEDKQTSVRKLPPSSKKKKESKSGNKVVENIKSEKADPVSGHPPPPPAKAKPAQASKEDRPPPVQTSKKDRLPPVHWEQQLPTREEQLEVQRILQKQQQGRSFLPLQAVVEESASPLWANPKHNYTYPKPLPLRLNPTLTTYSYFDKVHSCQDLPNGWPVDHPQSMDQTFGPVVNDLQSLYEQRHEYAKICPVDADPFLPWIHDVIPSRDGKVINFVAHNKRRCRSDPSHFRKDIDFLEPQVALLQPVPIQRLSSEELQQARNIPDDWKTSSRYRLAPIEDADPDGRETRFICQFHTLKPSGDDTVQKVLVGETLSAYPYNYEHAHYQHRRGQRPNPMLTRPKDDKDSNGMHNEQIWLAILQFQCPVPEHLQTIVAQGTSVYKQGDADIPSIYVDVVPIRTPPREGVNGYNPFHLDVSEFDPGEEWGSMHILPPVEKSGRWANVPICQPPDTLTIADNPRKEEKAITMPKEQEKENYLVGCLWASAAFSPRGEHRLDTSNQERLLEWLTYHLDVAGFDKMIVYDNTEAFTDETSLQPITDLFGDRVKRVPWKHRVCNNNRPTHPNPGERSSQYAAEASCRVRYGPTTEWMIAFDTDEYLVPQDPHTSIQEWLKSGVASGAIEPKTNILNFYQVRGSLNQRFAERYYDESAHCHKDSKSSHCLAKLPNATFLESYCESVQFPKPDWMNRAKKQLYRPSFVLNHFVHYAVVTRMINEEPTKPRVLGYPYERRAVEATEAFMIHTKTTHPRSTKSWKKTCVKADRCHVGFPWPVWQEDKNTLPENATNKDGYPYNCYENRKIHTVMVGKLRQALQKYQSKWNPHIDEEGARADEQAVAEKHPAAVPGANEAVIEKEKIRDFEPGLPAVIVTKIQGNSTLLQVEQSICLLKHAYNDRVNYDIVVFAANPITEEEINFLKAAAVPAHLEVHLDNPGLDKMIAALKPEQLEYLVQRCNVTDAAQLSWRTQCTETSSTGTTNMPIQYTWQAEFRSLHIWNHPAIAKYKYMMWLDSDGFCTKKWEQDPIATVARNDLAILFDHFPQGMAKGTEWGQKFQDAFGKVICSVEMVDGHLVAKEGSCFGKKLQIKQVHGFFHVTNLDFYRSEAAMKWFRIMVGTTKFSRMFDDQIGVTMPAAVYAGNQSWDMRSHGLNLSVFHSFHLDGHEPFGGFLNFWKTKGEASFPEAYGKCNVTNKG